MIPEYGGNLFNIEPVRDRVRVNFCDVRDVHAMNYLVRDQDYIFHLAGLGSHILSLSNPLPDIEINIKGTAILMEACKKYNPDARLIHTGTRGQYGPATRLPVSEDAPTNPKGIYEISNLAAEKIIKVYSDTHGVSSVLLRLTNTYGPRAQMKHSRYGVVNWFIRLAVDDETIPVFGDGSILRDFLYVDDCVEALLMSMACQEATGDIFNVGTGIPTNFVELAETIVRVAGTGRWQFAPFTPERKAQEPGNYYSDVSKIRQIVGWESTTSLEEGLRKTIAYYRLHKAHYW
jgi:UDP-glucose 4-epimerase